MKMLPQTWQSFKFTVGLLVIFSTISYGIFVTIMVIVFGGKACENQQLWVFVTNIVSTTLGWFMAKSSTIIDYIYGAAVKPLPYQGGKPNAPSVETPVNPVSGLAGPVSVNDTGVPAHINEPTVP